MSRRRLEDRLGSIESGKLADFTVLEQDPCAVGAAGLRKIKIWGTVFEGKVFPARTGKRSGTRASAVAMP